MESLIERRLHSDPGADPKLIRVSIGVEELEVGYMGLSLTSKVGLRSL